MDSFLVPGLIAIVLAVLWVLFAATRSGRDRSRPSVLVPLVLLTLAGLSAASAWLAFDGKWTDPASGVPCPNTKLWWLFADKDDLGAFSPEAQEHCGPFIESLTTVYSVGFPVAAALAALAVVIFVVRRSRRPAVNV